jgi:hypothetical protein
MPKKITKKVFPYLLCFSNESFAVNYQLQTYFGGDGCHTPNIPLSLFG